MPIKQQHSRTFIYVLFIIYCGKFTNHKYLYLAKEYETVPSVTGGTCFYIVITSTKNSRELFIGPAHQLGEMLAHSFWICVTVLDFSKKHEVWKVLPGSLCSLCIWYLKVTILIHLFILFDSTFPKVMDSG